MTRVLLIDDEPSSLTSLLDELRERATFECETCGFDEALETLERFRPGAVILDLLLQGSGSPLQVAGSQAFDHIWTTRFCPIVVYSAQPDALGEEQHPFVRRVQKGSGSEIEAADALVELAPLIAALGTAANELEVVIHQALKRVAPALYPREPAQLVKAVKRQVAARLDSTRFGDTPLDPWEHYVFPPVHSDLMLGDILKTRAAKVEDPRGFRVVLTPSCDLATSPKRAAKVSHVLVARCCPPETFLRTLGTKMSKVKGKLPAILNRGYHEAYLPLPKFERVSPAMVANLRDLELVPYAEVDKGEGTAPYIRIASIDSPFRELIVWAYLQVIGRPGLPPRDVAGWAEEICSTVTSAGDDNEGN